MDEAALCTKETWLILLGRLREPPGRAWITTTPRGFDWIYEAFAKTAIPGYDVIRSSTRDNVFLPADFIPRLEQQYTHQWQQQEIEGAFCELEGTMFKRHWFQTVEHAPEGLRWVRYWDLATSTKTASASVALSQQSGDVYGADMIHVKEEWPIVRNLIFETALAETGVRLGVESAIHGLAAFQELQCDP